MTTDDWDDDLPGDLRDLLADPGFWAEPSPETERAVLALIADAATAADSPPPRVTEADSPPPRVTEADSPPPRVTEADSPPVIDLRQERRRRSRVSPLAIAAAVVVLAGAAGVGFALGRSGDTDTRTELATPVFGGDVEPGAGIVGGVRLGRTTSGWHIDIDLTGLPRRADGEFYEAWLKDADGVLVSIGTFNEGTDVTLWAGVSPERFTTLTITREVADGDPTSSGDLVVAIPLGVIED